MSDFETEDAFDLGAKVAELTDSVGVLDDAGPATAVPNALADEVEDYAEHAQRRDEHLAEQPGDHVDEGEQQPQGKRQQHVPLGALQEERQRRQAAQAEAEALRQQIALQQQQLAQFQQMQQQLAAQQAEAEIPSFSDDPEGHVNALRQRFENELANMQGANQQRQQLEQAAVQVQQTAQQLAPWATQLEQNFRATHPDYDSAVEHVQQTIRSQLAQQYPGATAEQVLAMERHAQFNFLQTCAAQGIDPCQHIYGRAQQLGFATQARIPRKAAPTSLSNLPASGRAPDQRGAPSASQVAQMSNEDFDALFESMRASSGEGQFGF